MMQILFHNKFNHFFIYPFSNGTEFLYYDIIILLHQFKSGDIIFWVISCSLVSSLNKSVLVYSSHSYYNFHFQFHFLSVLIFTGLLLKRAILLKSTIIKSFLSCFTFPLFLSTKFHAYLYFLSFTLCITFLLLYKAILTSI